jgi:predicted nucleotidyltransferase
LQYTQRQVADLLGIIESNYRQLENQYYQFSLDTIDFLIWAISKSRQLLYQKSPHQLEGFLTVNNYLTRKLVKKFAVIPQDY